MVGFLGINFEKLQCLQYELYHILVIYQTQQNTYNLKFMTQKQQAICINLQAPFIYNLDVQIYKQQTT